MKEILILTSDRKLIKGKLCSLKDNGDKGMAFKMEITEGVVREGLLKAKDILIEVDELSFPNSRSQS